MFGLKLNIHVIMFSPVQDGGGVKNAPPTSFSPVASTIVEISLQNFLTFSFNLFATLVWNVKARTSASPILLNLN